jgi:hypothetical protein
MCFEIPHSLANLSLCQIIQISKPKFGYPWIYGCQHGGTLEEVQ